MKRKSLLLIIPIISFLSLTAITNLSIHNIKKQINNQIISTINDTNFLNENFTVSNSNSATILATTYNISDESSEDFYNISINNITNSSFDTITIDGSDFIKYSFDASLELTKDSTKYDIPLSSSIIVSKTSKEYILKSVDELKADITKGIISVKNKNLEDISLELSDFLLLYHNEELDIKLNYPDSYTYTSNTISSNDNVDSESVVTFYMSNDKKSNYIQLSMLTNSTLKNQEIIGELLSKGYQLHDSTFKTTNNIEFSVLTQTFNQDSKEVLETILVSKSGYKSLDELIVTAKIDIDNIPTKQKELEEIIKSIN